MKGNVQLIRLIGSFQEEAEERPWVFAKSGGASRQQTHVLCVCLFLKHGRNTMMESEIEKR